MNITERITKYLRQLAPHAANRESATLLRAACSELTTLRAEIEKSNIVMFTGDEMPTFSYGMPVDELTETVTPDTCTELVKLIQMGVSLRDNLSAQLAEIQKQEPTLLQARVVHGSGRYSAWIEIAKDDLSALEPESWETRELYTSPPDIQAMLDAECERSVSLQLRLNAAQDACRLAMNAFKRNEAIDWSIVEASAAKPLSVETDHQGKG